jgi:hypothetical protein
MYENYASLLPHFIEITSPSFYGAKALPALVHHNFLRMLKDSFAQQKKSEKE